MKPSAPSILAANWRAFRDTFLLRSVAGQIDGIRAGVAANHLCGLAETLNVPQTTIFYLVGLSPAAARQHIALSKNLSPSVSERLLRIAAIESLAVSVFSSSELAHAWLLERNFGLGNVSPLSLLDTEPGAKEVARILNAIAHGGAA